MNIFIKIIIIIIDVLFRFPVIDPIHAASPELLIAAAKVRPPPIKISTPQGMFLATSQFISLSLPERKEGRINSIIAAPIAILESLIAPVGSVFSNRLLIHLLEIHNIAVIMKTEQTIISSRDIFPNSLFFLKFIKGFFFLFYL